MPTRPLSTLYSNVPEYEKSARGSSREVNTRVTSFAANSLVYDLLGHSEHCDLLPKQKPVSDFDFKEYGFAFRKDTTNFISGLTK